MAISSFAPLARPFSSKVESLFGPYLGKDNLNLGCGRNPEPGFLNLDRTPGEGIDLVGDLETAIIPAPDMLCRAHPGSVDFILASHVLEHVSNLIPLMREIHRVLRQGGYLAAVTPYASSDDAVEDPTHVRYFTEKSWYYFDRRLYEKDGHAGSYDSPVDFCFDVVSVSLIPYPEWKDRPDLDSAKRYNRNVIREMIAILRKV